MNAGRAGLGFLIAYGIPQIVFAAPAAGAPAAAQLLKLVLGLVVVIAAVLVLSRVVARAGGLHSHAAADFKVLTSLAVGPKERVVLLQAGDRQILVGVTANHVNALHVLEQPLALDSATARDAHDSWLSATLARRLK